jgi:PAS domain S-box-containing protein
MVSSGLGEEGPRHRRVEALPGSRLRRWSRLFRNGAQDLLSIDAQKRVRLCKILALIAIAIMGPWVAVEFITGQPRNVVWEVPFLASFAGVLVLEAAGADRLARLLLIAAANACVLAGAVLYDRHAGGTLPFFALVGLPLLLFGQAEKVMLAIGAALPVALFIACEAGPVAQWITTHTQTAPTWYFAANVASTFAVVFAVPLFFYRSNLRAEAALEQLGQEKLKRVIDSNLIGVVRGRISGRIEDANDTFLSLLGYTRGEMETGAVDLKTIAPLDPLDAGCARALAQLGEGSVSAVYERTFHRKDGSAVPALVGISLLDGSDEVVGFVLDLTAQKQSEAQRAALRESQEELRLRDLFNSVASHELKTPLAALMLNLHLLRRRLDREAPTNATLRAHVERCESSSARMGELIHALLDVAQIHEGQLKLSLREMDVVEAARRVVNAFEAAKDAPLQRIDVRAEESVIARLDALRFDQVLTNLLSNALKYGAGKPIEVRVRRDRERDLAHLEVIDQGTGIDPALTEKIFEPFQRGVSADAPTPGLGLGLYVVKTIVEGHRGTIRVESAVGQGSRFIVDLPCATTSRLTPA